MTRIRVELIDVYCKDTEDLTGADDFYLVGALVGGGVTKAILTRPIKIHDRERKSFYPEDCLLFEGDVEEGQVIKGGMNAYDEDAGKDWANKYHGTVQKIGAAVSTMNNPNAANIVSAATSAINSIVSLDADDLLGTCELEISAVGPAHEVREWKMSKKNSFMGWSTWDYTVRFQISRS